MTLPPTSCSSVCRSSRASERSDVWGSALPAGAGSNQSYPAVFHYGIGLEDIRAALASANANSPKGAIEDETPTIRSTQTTRRRMRRNTAISLVAYRNGAAVKLSDIAEVVELVEDLRNAGLVNGNPGIVVSLLCQPGANIITAADNVRAELPRLSASLPGDINLTVAVDRSKTIRQSLADTEKTLSSPSSVIFVVFAFLRARSRRRSSPASPFRLRSSARLAEMHLLGFTLDNLSLMALTISTGFVVDDAIVVLENVSRYLEQGMPRLQAAITGANEVGFTVLSISLSLIAVFAAVVFSVGSSGACSTNSR